MGMWRAALAFAGEGSRSAALLGKLLARQGRFAWHLGRYREARGLLEASLHRDGPSRGEGRAYALNELATVAYLQGNFAEAKALCHDSLRLYRELAQPRGVARVLSNLAIVAFAQGSYREAKALHQESLALRRQLGDALAIAYTLANLGDTAYVLGEYQEAKALIGESLAIRTGPAATAAASPTRSTSWAR